MLLWNSLWRGCCEIILYLLWNLFWTFCYERHGENAIVKWRHFGNTTPVKIILEFPLLNSLRKTCCCCKYNFGSAVVKLILKMLPWKSIWKCHSENSFGNAVVKNFLEMPSWNSFFEIKCCGVDSWQSSWKCCFENYFRSTILILILEILQAAVKLIL